jgi:hypothetical protein
MTTTDCPPLPLRITKSLLGYGVIAGPIYVLAAAVQMATRDGFDPTRHAASQLANGDLGWIQIATFLVTGAMTIAAAVGVRRALGPGRLSAGYRVCSAYTAPVWSAQASSGPIRRTGSRRALRLVWVRSVGMVWPISWSRALVLPAWSPGASSSELGSPATDLAHGHGSPASLPCCSQSASRRCRPDHAARQRFWCSPRRSCWSGPG